MGWRRRYAACVRCPACQILLSEHDAACQQCGLSLDAVDKLLGIPPNLQKPITDTQGALTFLARKKVEHCITEIERRHPLLHASVIFMNVPQQVSVGVYAFWLFNRGGLCSPVDKGGANHHVMLLIDPATSRAAAIVGYGLEPFVSLEALQLCLNEFAGAARTGSLAAGVAAFLAELDERLRLLCDELPRQFGYDENADWYDSSVEGQVIDPAAASNRKLTAAY